MKRVLSSFHQRKNLSFNTNITFVESRIDMTDREFNSLILNYERVGETLSNTRQWQVNLLAW